MLLYAYVQSCAIVLSILKSCCKIPIALCFRLCCFRERYNLHRSKLLLGLLDLIIILWR